jgi:hypothetical protein
MNEIEIRDREKIRNLFSSLDSYKDIMSPNQAVYITSARKKFLENHEIPYFLEWGQWDNLNAILNCLRMKSISQKPQS